MSTDPILDVAERIVRTARSDLATLESAIRLELEKRDLRIQELEGRKTSKRLVLIESPFGTRPDGTRCRPVEVKRNTRYARALMRHFLLQGCAVFASHCLYTLPGVLRDDEPGERTLGIDAGLCIGSLFDESAIGVDLGITSGMRTGIARAIKEGRAVVPVSLPGWATDESEKTRAAVIELLGGGK